MFDDMTAFQEQVMQRWFDGKRFFISKTLQEQIMQADQLVKKGLLSKRQIPHSRNFEYELTQVGKQHRDEAQPETFSEAKPIAKKKGATNARSKAKSKTASEGDNVAGRSKRTSK